MLFTNEHIIKSPKDFCIGAINTNKKEISNLDYMLAVENRLLTLIVVAVRESMSHSVDKETAIADLCTFIYSKLSVLDKKYPDTMEGLAAEIMDSEEFQNWSADIWYRFKNTHLGVVTKETPIPCHGKLHPDIDSDTVELVEKEDSLQVVIDGLAALNFHD